MQQEDRQYRIKFVGEDDLPPTQDFVFLECDGEVWLAVKRTRLSERTLEEAWAAFRDLADDV